MKRIITILLVLLSFVSCKKDIDLGIYQVVINDEITALSPTNATIVVNYTYNSKLNLKLLYGVNSDMSDSESLETIESENGFTFNLSDLMPDTRYYYCIEYTNGLSADKSKVKSFDTPGLPINQVLVTVKAVTEITATSAKSVGNIQIVGDVQIIGRGVCYSNNPNPTINDSITSNGSGPGEFTSLLNGLDSNTVYYLKAYAKTTDSVFYSNEQTFKTSSYALPVVTTNMVSDITNTTAICGGNVTDEGDAAVLVKGICWSTSADPTINDNFTMDGNGLGSFISTIDGLQPNTTYYVKAYATNPYGTSYGESQSFTTLNIPTDNYFSVSVTDKVLFSSGNLQFNPAANTWRFAEKQYDIIGDGNQNISNIYNGWLDLFGWGTSGYNGCYPWLSVIDNAAYGDGANNITGTMYDWGLYIDINNTQGEWRTLTKAEWAYVIDSRNNASCLRSRATIMGVHGLILLPDNWVKPEGIGFVEDAISWSANSYNESEWTIMEESHAVFLPAAGDRYETTINSFNNVGGYWSTNSGGNIGAYYFMFSESNYSSTLSGQFMGRSVRLVQDYHLLDQK